MTRFTNTRPRVCLGLSGKTVIYRHSTVDTLCMTTSTKVVNFILYSLDGSKSLTMYAWRYSDSINNLIITFDMIYTALTGIIL